MQAVGSRGVLCAGSSLAERGERPLPPWMEMLDGVGLTATTLCFMGA